VLPALPSEQLGLLEGQNGVGKTAALRVLQLCTGDTSTWRSDLDLWRSFCRLLGTVDVEVDGLRALGETSATSHSLHWKFNLSGLAEAVPEELAETDFESLELDGKATTMRVVRQLFEVERVDGSEDMPQTLRRLIGAETRVAEQAVRRLRWSSAEVERRFTAWRERYAIDDASAWLDATQKTVELESATSRFEEKSRETDERASFLTQASEANRLLEEVQGETARGLHAQKTELAAEVATLENAEAEQAANLAAVSAAHEAQTELSTALSKSESLFQKRLRTLETRSERAETAGAPFGVQAAEDIEPLVNEVDLEIQQAEEQLAAVSAAEGVGPVTEDLRRVLTEARDKDLGDRTVAIFSDRDVDAVQLLAAVDRRRQELAKTALGLQLEALKDRLDVLRARRKGLADVERLFELVANARANLAESETELSELKKRTDPDTVERRQAELTEGLSHTRGLLTDKRVSLALVQGQIDRIGAGRAAVDLQNDRDRFLGLADVELSDLAEALTRVTAAVDAARLEAEERATQRAELNSVVERAGAQLQRMVEDMDGVEGPITISRDTAVADAANAVTSLDTAINAELERNRDMTQTVARIANALRSLADRVAGVTPTSGSKEAQSALAFVTERWERRLLVTFGTPAVAATVFDGGRLVRVNLEERQFEWEVDKDAPTRVRPFSGFSSGEQAFAYTQARIAELGERGSANKLLAVDEFGAYLSIDRRERLVGVIRDAVLGERITQAVLVLPLQIDVTVDDAVLPPGTHQDLGLVREQRWLTAPLSPIGAS
jgi:hypothetical protein